MAGEQTNGVVCEDAVLTAAVGDDLFVAWKLG
jgi:hypothetical protein